MPFVSRLNRRPAAVACAMAIFALLVHPVAFAVAGEVRGELRSAMSECAASMPSIPRAAT